MKSRYENYCPHKNMQGKCKKDKNNIYFCYPMTMFVCAFHNQLIIDEKNRTDIDKNETMNESVGSCGKHLGHPLVNCPKCAAEIMQMDKTLVLQKETIEHVDTSLKVIYAHIDNRDDMATETYMITPLIFRKIVANHLGYEIYKYQRFDNVVKKSLYENQITEQQWLEYLKEAQDWINNF